VIYEEHYVVGKWQDLTRYACKHDPYDTFDLAAMREHIDQSHGDAMPAPDLEVIRRDRFGNTVNPAAPTPPVEPPGPPAPLSKEVPEDWDPHRSHEERGLPIPKLNEHGKRAIEKAGKEGYQTQLPPVAAEEPKPRKSKAKAKAGES
jgi:hypothetical protein